MRNPLFRVVSFSEERTYGDLLHLVAQEVSGNVYLYTL